ncbi:grifin-like [Babylonia areolata]|uniref:grifin-like n=1 Tax=Babylonia areolata TaxID=304850 RepID=UPI003FCF9873
MEYPMPRALYVGWAMCVRGTACSSCDRFGFDLFQSSSHMLAHIAVRFNEMNVVPTSFVGYWIDGPVAGSFPFAHGQPFEVEFRLQDMSHLQMHVNGTPLLLYGAPESFTTTTKFRKWPDNDDTTLQFVDLGAGCP